MSLSILECFQLQLPDNLYRNHYTLAQIYTTYTADEWRNFLKEHEHFIRTETAAIAEAEARSALQKLTRGDAKAADISAIKQLMEKAEELNQRSKDQRTFVVTHMPTQTKTVSAEEERYLLHQNNLRNVELTFNGLDILNRENVRQNADGTIHLDPPMTAVDHTYLRLFNPTNKLQERPEPLDRGDVQ